MNEQSWQLAVVEAEAVANRAGQLPGGMKEALNEAREPKVDWVAETREFLTNTVVTDSSFARPNRRFISSGIYLPGAVKNNVGKIVLVIDTSGSTYHIREQFAGELGGLLRDTRPEELIVLYVDTEVQDVRRYTPHDEDPELSMMGGGGTAFTPAFQWVEENDIDPIALIYLTDLYGDNPTEPPYPVLWATPIHSNEEAPFGQLVRIP